LLRAVYLGQYSERFSLRTQKTNPSDVDLANAIRRLEGSRVVRRDPDLGPSFYQIFDVFEQSAETVCCIVDPFCYLSHLSAMQMQGLTDRNPVELTLTRPVDSLWRQMLAETKHSPSHHRQDTAYTETKYRIPEKVRDRSVLVHETRHPGFYEVMGGNVRVATVGQAFLDMVVRPNWCGGVLHILEIWEREAKRHLEEIIRAISEYPIKLPKVRAGYILDEVLGVSDDRILAWREFAQRGGSQKLDPEKPYAPTYSENWKISLNA
jgi:predicted transcriptional regulator of viral defense system